jgi:hypothetical protein
VNNKQESAKKLFEWMYSDSADGEERFHYLTKTIEEESWQQQANKARYVECFQGTNLKRTLNIMFLFGIVNLGGAPFLSQSIYFLISVGLPAIHVFDISVGGFGLAITIIIASGGNSSQELQTQPHPILGHRHQSCVQFGDWSSLLRT